MIHLDNPYIEAFVLPATGGKLIGAVEKGTQKDFIYYNHVLKFRNISMRGPWTSGGIEANFGIIGHAPSTATPVDYLIRKNPDGSVSCIVGNMDLPSRTQWRVEYSIPPDKAYIEVHSLWYNPQPLNQSYYVWMNVAQKLARRPRIRPAGSELYRAQLRRPVPAVAADQGRAKPGLLTATTRTTTMTACSCTASLQDFAGGYWHDWQFGYGHWALHEEVPGQKLFLWSLSRAGAIWQDLLTDSDGPYFEPQTGRLLDQSDHEFLAPDSADHWRELYFPYKKIGPMVKATPYGALNVRNDGNALVVSFCALQKIDEDLTVSAEGKQIPATESSSNPWRCTRRSFRLRQRGRASGGSGRQALLHGRSQGRPSEASAPLPQFRREQRRGALPVRPARREGPELRFSLAQVSVCLCSASRCTFAP